MKYRWPALAALTLLPFGVALADYGAAAPPAATTPPAERSVEHASFIESAEQSLGHATRASRELSVALENARREQDMLLVTCLSEALESIAPVHQQAIATLGAMNATRTEGDARALTPQIVQANQQIIVLLENAARCEGDAEGATSTTLFIDRSNASTTEPGGSRVGARPGSFNPNPLPTVVPPATLTTINVMEPGTDTPYTPPTGSPMR